MPKDLAEAFVSVDRCDPSWGRDKDDGARFSPDFPTSAQYHRAPVASPHHRLLLAILEDGIRCFQRNFAATNGPRRILFRETEAWLFDSDGTAFLSCPIVCESLGIDPVQLRRCLREWRLRKKAGQDAPCLARRRPVPAESHHHSPDVYSAQTTPTEWSSMMRGRVVSDALGAETSGSDTHLT